MRLIGVDLAGCNDALFSHVRPPISNLLEARDDDQINSANNPSVAVPVLAVMKLFSDLDTFAAIGDQQPQVGGLHAELHRNLPCRKCHLLNLDLHLARYSAIGKLGHFGEITHDAINCGLDIVDVELGQRATWR